MNFCDLVQNVLPAWLSVLDVQLVQRFAAQVNLFHTFVTYALVAQEFTVKYIGQHTGVLEHDLSVKLAIDAQQVQQADGARRFGI